MEKDRQATYKEEGDHFVIKLITKEKSKSYRIDKNGKCTQIN